MRVLVKALVADAAGAAEIGEGEVRVPIIEEEVVAEKRPVVKEEVVVKKRAVEETEDVEAELRKKKIDVDKGGRSTREETSGAARSARVTRTHAHRRASIR